MQGRRVTDLAALASGVKWQKRNSLTAPGAKLAVSLRWLPCLPDEGCPEKNCRFSKIIRDWLLLGKIRAQRAGGLRPGLQSVL